MRLQLLAAAALIAGLTGVADAHGPTRQKTQQTVEINAPADKVWAVAGDFQKPSWIPAVEKAEGQGGNEKDATRTLTLKGGGIVKEQLTKHDDAGKSFAFRITDVDVKVFPVSNFSSTFTVKGEGDKSTVTWAAAFYRGYPNNDPPPELSDEAAKKAVDGFFRASLDALKEKVEKGS
jgi:carbon monoxide dehydrogenase subunit G